MTAKKIKVESPKSFEMFGVKIVRCPFPLPAGVVGFVPVFEEGRLNAQKSFIIRDEKLIPR